MPYKGVELQSLERDDNMEDSKPLPFSRLVGNARLSATGKTLRIHFFEGNRFFVIGIDSIKEAIERPTTVISVKEYESKE